MAHWGIPCAPQSICFQLHCIEPSAVFLTPVLWTVGLVILRGTSWASAPACHDLPGSRQAHMPSQCPLHSRVAQARTVLA